SRPGWRSTPGSFSWRSAPPRKPERRVALRPRAPRGFSGRRRPLGQSPYRAPKGPRPTRRAALPPRDPPPYVPRAALDDAPVRGIRNRGSVEPALSLPPLARADGTLGRVRSADADGL